MADHPRTSHPAGHTKRRRARVFLWLRVAIALVLMGVVIELVLSDREQLANVDWRLIPVAWVLMLTSTVVKAYRWSMLMRVSQMHIGFRRLLGTYFVGSFFSTFLPTSFGGDAVRAVDTAVKTGRAADSTSSVVIERGIGLLAVIGGGSVFALFLDAKRIPPGFELLVHAMFVCGVIGLVVLRQGWFTGPLMALLTRFGLGRLADKVRNLQSAFRDHLSSPGVVLVMLILSIIANTLTMAATYLVLLAVTDPIPLASFVPMIALSTVAELLPISIAALGVKESAYIFFLGLAGVGQIEAGVIAIIMRVLTWALALVGGAVYVVRALGARPGQTPPPPPGRSRRSDDRRASPALVEHGESVRSDLVRVLPGQ